MAFHFLDKLKKKLPVQKKKDLVPVEESVKESLAPVQKEFQKAKSRSFPGVAEHRLLLRPLLTEKTVMNKRKGVYVFHVASDANKISVRKAFYNVYGLMPSSVRMLRRQGKVVRSARSFGKRSDEKHAIITLPQGKTIDVF